VRTGQGRVERAEWFDPRTGARQTAEARPAGNATGFTSPSTEDWALDLEVSRPGGR